MSKTQKHPHDTYHEDEKNSWKIHSSFMVYFYKNISLNGQFTPIKGDLNRGKSAPSTDKLTIWLQMHGVDVTTTSKQNGTTVYWDEKADWHFPQNFCLETHSNTAAVPWKPGWTQTSLAHWLLYSFIYLPKAVDTYAIPFPRLQRWFWPVHEKYRAYDMPDTLNHTRSRLVPVIDVLNNVKGIRHHLITDAGEVAEIPLHAPASDYLKNGSIVRTREITIYDGSDEKVIPLLPKIRDSDA